MVIGTKLCFVLCVCVSLFVRAADLDSEDAENKEDYDIEEDFEETVKEELQNLKDWYKEERYPQQISDNPLCPPSASLLTGTSCNATKCAADSDCEQNNKTYICCFNGCVDTCIEPLDPPIVIDWIEDPPDRKLIVPPKAEHLNPPEEMVFQGGCVITPTQFVSLERFKKNVYVSDCFCDIGGIFCKIKERGR